MQDALSHHNTGQPGSLKPATDSSAVSLSQRSTAGSQADGDDDFEQYLNELDQDEADESRRPGAIDNADEGSGEELDLEELMKDIQEDDATGATREETLTGSSLLLPETCHVHVSYFVQKLRPMEFKPLTTYASTLQGRAKQHGLQHVVWMPNLQAKHEPGHQTTLILALCGTAWLLLPMASLLPYHLCQHSRGRLFEQQWPAACSLHCPNPQAKHEPGYQTLIFALCGTAWLLLPMACLLPSI